MAKMYRLVAKTADGEITDILETRDGNGIVRQFMKMLKRQGSISDLHYEPVTQVERLKASCMNGVVASDWKLVRVSRF